MELRETEFNEMVLKSDRPVLVDFWASWCPPCKMMQPVVDKLAVKVGDWADVYSINIDRSPSLASLYQISGVPTFVAYAGGEVIDRKTGALTENQLIALLRKAEEAMPDEIPSEETQCDEAFEAALEHDADLDLSSFAASANGDEILEPTELNDIEHSGPTLNTDSATSADSQEFSSSVREIRIVTPDHASADSMTPEGPFITVVSGLPRSGTSLMMRMLNVGGIPALCDDSRTPDADNPNGYYEFQDVKSIEAYDHWIDRAPGHAVKMVYSLLKHLPGDREYRVIFMRRHTDEILKSQRAMLERNGITVEIPDDQLKAAFERELRQFYAWLPSQTHLKLINVSYNELLSRPDSTISHINSHLNFSLNTDAMTQVIDSNLYRNRAA
jgi:thioredoxin